MIREAILKEIEQRSLKQTELSEMSGVSKNQIHKFLHGKSLNIENVDKICMALSLDIIKIY